jgi:hypothetical protein
MFPLNMAALENIDAIFSTLDTSHPDRSSSNVAFHWNSSDISVTPETHQVPMGYPYLLPASQELLVEQVCAI